MSKHKRREFLKMATALAAAPIANRTVAATENTKHPENRYGVLVDTTICIGCRKCEYACKVAHQLKTEGPESYQDRSVFRNKRRPDDGSLTVVNAYPAEGEKSEPVTVKVQCMHCEEPACLSACIVGAFSKDEHGAVSWDESKCIGCRYCLIACPFQIPAYEYNKPLEPKVVKCDWCIDRQNDGLLPACVDICPVEALTYGRRADLLAIALQKIKKYPQRYVDHIYGQSEVGGTSWLYLAAKPFENLDFPRLQEKTAPGVTEAIQHGVFAYFVPPLALYAILGGVMWITKNNKEEE